MAHRSGQNLYELFQEVAESAPSEEVRQPFQGHSGRIEAPERKLSKEYQRFEDL